MHRECFPHSVRLAIARQALQDNRARGKVDRFAAQKAALPALPQSLHDLCMPKEMSMRVQGPFTTLD